MMCAPQLIYDRVRYRIYEIRIKALGAHAFERSWKCGMVLQTSTDIFALAIKLDNPCISRTLCQKSFASFDESTNLTRLRIYNKLGYSSFIRREAHDKLDMGVYIHNHY